MTSSARGEISFHCVIKKQRFLTSRGRRVKNFIQEKKAYYCARHCGQWRGVRSPFRFGCNQPLGDASANVENYDSAISPSE